MVNERKKKKHGGESERNVFYSDQKTSREGNEVYKGISNYILVVLFGLKKKKKKASDTPFTCFADS